MSQPPDDDRSDREQDPQQPSWSDGSERRDVEGEYPYAPQPWGAPDPQSSPPPPHRSGESWPTQPDHSSSAYGTGGYGYPQPGYPPPGGYGVPPRHPEQSSLRTQGIVSLVLNILSVFTCCNIFGIAGAVLAGISLGKIDQDLPHAKNLIRWSWVLLGAGLALVVLAAVAYIALFAVSGAIGF